MRWKITCHNGTVWEAPSIMSVTNAVSIFITDTGLHEMDIKSIVDLS